MTDIVQIASLKMPQKASVLLQTSIISISGSKRLLGVENRNVEIDSIVLECLQGENLDGLVARNQGLAEPLIRLITKQIFNAIHFIHSKGIIHRDVKSANIMIVGNNYQVKLMDFGMGKRVANAFTLQDDSNQSVVGTLAYMVRLDLTNLI